MKISKILALTSAMLVFGALYWTTPVWAEGNTYSVSFPVTVSNPDGKIPAETEFTLVIDGQSHTPLPDPSEIQAKANGTYEFAPIQFDEPGNYRYTVKQIPPADQKIIPDSSEYEIIVTVVRTESGDLDGGFTISTQTGDGKPDAIAFSNAYKSDEKIEPSNPDDKDPSNPDDKDPSNPDDKPKESSTPPTGEPLSPAFGGLALSGVLFLLFLAYRKRQRKSAAIRGDAE